MRRSKNRQKAKEQKIKMKIGEVWGVKEALDYTVEIEEFLMAAETEEFYNKL